MTAIEIVQRYFDSWNSHDPSAVLATFTEGGTYDDSASNGPLSSGGIAVILKLHKRLQDGGQELILTNLSGRVRTVFHYAGLESVFTIK